jgi:aminopeptidase N
VLAKNTPNVYWNSIPLEQMSGWIKPHLEEGMTQTLENSLDTARFKLEQKTRLVRAANQIAGFDGTL